MLVVGIAAYLGLVSCAGLDAADTLLGRACSSCADTPPV